MGARLVPRLAGRGFFGDEHEILDQREIVRLGHHHHHVDVIRAGDDQRARHELIGEGDDPAQRRHVGEVDRVHLLQPPDRGTGMGAEHVARRHAILEERADRLRVEAGDVIAFEEGVHDELPVGLYPMGLAPEQEMAGGAEGVHVRADGLGMGEVRIPARREPDQAAAFKTGQFDEAVRLLVEAGKAVGAGQSKQAPVHRIGPGVIGADELLRALDCLTFHQPRAAMAADIEEDVGLPLRIACDQQRASGRIVRHRHAGIGQQGAGAQDLRHPIVKRGAFAGEMGWIGIDRCRNRLNAAGARRAAIGDRPGERELASGGASIGDSVGKRHRSGSFRSGRC